MENGINVSEFRFAADMSVIDIVLGVDLHTVEGIGGIGRIVVERPREAARFGFGILVHLAFCGLVVYLGEIERHVVIMLEEPGDEIERKLRLRKSAAGAESVHIIGFVEEIDIGIDLYRIRHGSHDGAVGSEDIDVFVGLYLTVQNLYADVLAESSHFAFAYHDVGDENTAVNGEVVPAHHGNVIVVVENALPGYRAHFVVIIAVPVDEGVRFFIPVEPGGRVDIVGIDETYDGFPVGVIADIEVIVHDIIEHVVSIGAVLVVCHIEAVSVEAAHHVEDEFVSVDIERAHVNRRVHYFGLDDIVVGIRRGFVGNADFHFFLTEFLVEELLFDLLRFDDIEVAVGVIEDIFLSVVDGVPAGYAHTELVRNAYRSGIYEIGVIIFDVLVKYFEGFVVFCLRAEPDDIDIVLEIVEDLVAEVVENGVVFGILVVHGVQFEFRVVVGGEVVIAVISRHRCGNGLERLPFVVFIFIIYEVVDALSAEIGKDMDVIISLHAHKEPFRGRHVIRLVVDDFDAVLVVKEEEIARFDAGAEIEIHGNGVMEFHFVNAVAHDVFELAHRVHGESDFELIYVEHALFEADLNGNGTDEFVHAEEVFNGLVGSGDADDVGLESRPGVFHQRLNDIGKAHDYILVLVIEVVAHIVIEALDEMVFSDFEFRHTFDANVIEPDVAEFFYGVCGIEADVVGVNARKRRDLILNDHVEVKAESATGAASPSAVIEDLFAYVLVVIEREINIRGFGQDKGRIEPALVAHKRAEQLRKVHFFGSREDELSFEVAGISHNVFEGLEAVEARENDFDVFADMLRIEVEAHNELRTVLLDFLLRHFGGGVDFEADAECVHVVSDVEIRFFDKFFHAYAENSGDAFDIDIELLVNEQDQLFRRIIDARFARFGQNGPYELEVHFDLNGGARRRIVLVLHRGFHIGDDRARYRFVLAFAVLRSRFAVQYVVDGNDYVLVYEFEKLGEGVREIEAPAVGFRQAYILDFDASVEVLQALNVDISKFVGVIKSDDEVVGREVSALHEDFVDRVVDLVHIGTEKNVEFEVEHRDIHIAGVLVITVIVKGVAFFVENDIGRNAHRIFRGDMRGIRNGFADRTEHGVGVRHLGIARNVENESRHYLFVDILVGSHNEFHIGVDRRERGIAEGGNEEAEVFIAQRVELVLVGAENTLHEFGDVLAKGIEVDVAEENRGVVAVQSLFVVIGDGEVKRFAQTLEGRIRRTVLGSGADERLEVEIGNKPYKLLIQNGIAEILEYSLASLKIEVEVVTCVRAVGVDTVEIETDEHLVGRAVVPLENDVGITYEVVMLGEGFLVHEGKSRILVENDVAVLILDFVRISVEVGLKIESESGTRLGVYRDVRADVIAGGGNDVRVEVGKQVFHTVDRPVDSLILSGVIYPLVVVGVFENGVLILIRRFHGIASRKHSDEQRRENEQ